MYAIIVILFDHDVLTFIFMYAIIVILFDHDVLTFIFKHQSHITPSVSDFGGTIYTHVKVVVCLTNETSTIAFIAERTFPCNYKA